MLPDPVLYPTLARARTWRQLAGASLVLALTAACGGGAPEGAAGGPPGGGGFAVPVEMVTLEPTPVERATEFVGVVKSRRSTTIQPQVEGYLRGILVKSGDRVTAGTPLFDIDSTPQQAAVATLESQRAARQADATFARQQAERAKTLLDVGAMSQQEYEQAVAQQAAAEAQLKAVEEQIRQQQAELAYYRVVSPVAGVVGDVPVRVGDRVTRTTDLTTVDDNAGLEVYVNVPVQQAPELRIGLPINIISEAGAVIATERITYVAASVDDSTQTVLVKAPLAQRGGQFRSDQFVRARIVWSTEPSLTVPVVSVVRVSGRQFVYVAESANGGLVARQRPVQLASAIGDVYPVISGVTAGDRLITSGIQKIGDGAPVQTMPPPGAGRGGGDAGRGGAPGEGGAAGTGRGGDAGRGDGAGSGRGGRP
ncbi:MAG: efflux RND transporter periplasmic adaptor subunit [Vicinamibacterales bacterium]